MTIRIPAQMFELWRACEKKKPFRYPGLTSVRIVADGQRVLLTATDGAIIAHASYTAIADSFTCYLHRDAARLVARAGGMAEIDVGVVKAGDLSLATSPGTPEYFPRNIEGFGFERGRYYPGTEAHNTLFSIASKVILADTFSCVRLGEISEFKGSSMGVDYCFFVASASKPERVKQWPSTHHNF